MSVLGKRRKPTNNNNLKKSNDFITVELTYTTGSCDERFYEEKANGKRVNSADVQAASMSATSSDGTPDKTPYYIYFSTNDDKYVAIINKKYGSSNKTSNLLPNREQLKRDVHNFCLKNLRNRIPSDARASVPLSSRVHGNHNGGRKTRKRGISRRRSQRRRR